MKKVLLSTVSFLLIASLMGCNAKPGNGETSQTTADTVETTVAPDIPVVPDEKEEITFTSGLNITNNDVYDGQRREFDFCHLVGEYGGLEVYDEGNLTFCSNVDGAAIYKVLVKNVSDRELGFTFKDPSLGGSYAQYETWFEILLHPNGCANYVLKPGEEKVCEFDHPMNKINADTDLVESISIDITMGVLEESGNYSEYDMSFEKTVEVLTHDTLMSDEYLNAVVEGRVIDENGNPLPGCEVEVFCPMLDERIFVNTDAKGEYSIKVAGATNSITNAWREASLIVKNEGYNQRYIPIYPKSNQTITAEVTLYEKEFEYVYEEVKSLDVGLQAYEYDTNQNDIISFVPFHTEYDSKDVADKIRLTTTDFDGNVMYEYSMPNEIPYVDVSEDGQYTVVANNFNDNGGFEVVILDRSGKEVYKTHDLKAVEKKYAPDQSAVDTTLSRCWQLSNDNKYLVVSDMDGDIWFIDWQNDKVLWSDYQFGQVRNIKFDKDSDVFYLNTGAGGVFCYDFDGNIKWQSEVQSWATKMEVTSKYIVMILKCNTTNLFVLDKTNGDIAWSYDTMQANCTLSVSPDEKHLWYGAHSSSSYSAIGSSVFDLDTGELVGMLTYYNCRGGQFSKDGGKIVARGYSDICVYDAKTGALLWRKEFCSPESPDYNLNLAAAINEDGTKIAVALNDKNDLPYGVVHFCALKEIKEYQANVGNNNQPSDSNNNGPDMQNKVSVVQLNFDDNSLILYLNDRNDVIDYSVPEGSDNKITDKLNRDLVVGRYIADALPDILKAANEAGIIKDGTKVEVILVEIDSEHEANYKDVLSRVEDKLIEFKDNVNIDFTYNVDDENYRISQ